VAASAIVLSSPLSLIRYSPLGPVLFPSATMHHLPSPFTLLPTHSLPPMVALAPLHALLLLLASVRGVPSGSAGEGGAGDGGRVVRMGEGMDMDLRGLGSGYGIYQGGSMSPEAVHDILRGAEAGEKEAMYYSALLKLYGVGVGMDIKGAVSGLREAAEEHHVEAQMALGWVLVRGIPPESPKSPRAGVAWLQLAAQAGNLDAMWLLGQCHVEGLGVEREDRAEGERWLLRAADGGSTRAMHALGVLHEYSGNFGKARDWYHKSARSFNAPESDYNLGLMHAFGRGGKVDHVAAALHFQIAAEAGHTGGMYWLGKACLWGQGVPINYDLALLWFERSAQGGHTKGAAAAEELTQLLAQAHETNTAIAARYDYGGKRARDGEEVHSELGIA
jgi:TPR repeat protein